MSLANNEYWYLVLQNHMIVLTVQPLIEPHDFKMCLSKHAKLNALSRDNDGLDAYD